MREGCSYTYPPLSIVKYSFIQLSELEQCRVKQNCPRFLHRSQDSNPGSRSRESEAVPVRHCALLCRIVNVGEVSLCSHHIGMFLSKCRHQSWSAGRRASTLAKRRSLRLTRRMSAHRAYSHEIHVYMG